MLMTLHYASKTKTKSRERPTWFSVIIKAVTRDGRFGSFANRLTETTNR